jgi:hypothetical protein
VCVVITVAMVILLSDLRPYRIIFMTVFTALDFPVILDGQFSGILTNIRLDIRNILSFAHFPCSSFYCYISTSYSYRFPCITRISVSE